MLLILPILTELEVDEVVKFALLKADANESVPVGDSKTLAPLPPSVSAVTVGA